MLAQLDGQLSLFDIPASVFEIAHCPACHSHWGAEHARKSFAQGRRLAAEHAIQPDGRCAWMHQVGITEPYYTLAEIPLCREMGYRLQYPRPKGFGGFYGI